MRNFFFTALLLALTFSPGLNAQEKSVRPGINDPFKKPDVSSYVEKFEVESREVFEKRKEIVGALNLQPRMIIADVGAGKGLFTRLFATSVGPKGKVLAVDISREFLTHIKNTSKQLGQENIETILGDDFSPKLPPNGVDVVFICDTYHHFEYPIRMMTEIHKSLKPGGKVVVVDFHRQEGKSSDWTLKHVRAGQEVFEKEILSCNFVRKPVDIPFLKDNYLMVFEKK